MNVLQNDIDRLRFLRHVALDLDGTVYLGESLFEWTGAFLETLRELKIGYTFVTNNSSRTPVEYEQRLFRMGLDGVAGHVRTSTEAAIEYLQAEWPSLRRIFPLGTPSFQEQFCRAGYRSCGMESSPEPEAVIVGFDTSLTYERLCRAAYWIGCGKLFIATHPDLICPTNRPTLLLDCGSICAGLTVATGRQPDKVVGKPNPAMIQGILDAQGLLPEEMAVVGDRLYTDIRMARDAGAWGILVLSGETTRKDVADSSIQPDWVVRNVGELGDWLRRANRGYSLIKRNAKNGHKL
jgi:NagD protein